MDDERGVLELAPEGVFDPDEARCTGSSPGSCPSSHADGPDISRSSAGRAGGEALWLPTALRPRFGVAWDAPDSSHITARFAVDGALTIRTAGRFGWGYGTEAWTNGEFFRYQLTTVEPVGEETAATP